MPNWKEVLEKIKDIQSKAQAELNGAGDLIRRHYLQELFKHTKRNVIAYYSGYLSKPGLAQSDINDEDKNGFMMAVHRLDRSNGLDLILHTPGGDVAATQSIVNYLQKMFNKDIRAIVPQIAMSAGTMIACSCKTILLTEHSNLGPIDPHLRGIPAYGVIEEFKRAYREIQQSPAKIAVWEPILSQYRPTFLSQCENAIKWSNMFVREQLEKVMFKGVPDAKIKALKITKELSSYRKNKTHNRHLHLEDCKKLGLKVIRIEDDNTLQDLILTVHHCYMHSLMNSPAYKIIENQNGVALIKQQTPQVNLNR